MSQTKNILLVCTGNSCRSVMAAGLLEKLLKGKDDYKISTAGTSALNGMRPTFEAVQAMSEEGIDVSGHRSILLNGSMIDKADLILVMERVHKEYILSRKPEVEGKVHLLNEFGRSEKETKLVSPDVPDPIGRPLQFYQEVARIIKESLERVVKTLGE